MGNESWIRHKTFGIGERRGQYEVIKETNMHRTNTSIIMFYIEICIIYKLYIKLTIISKYNTNIINI